MHINFLIVITEDMKNVQKNLLGQQKVGQLYILMFINYNTLLESKWLGSSVGRAED